MVGNIPIGRFDILGSDYASLLNGVYKELDSALFLKDAYINWISWKGERMSVSLADIISDDARIQLHTLVTSQIRSLFAFLNLINLSLIQEGSEHVDSFNC